MKNALTLVLFCLMPLSAQDVKFPESFDKLAAKAKETVNISLDGSMLQLAGNFLSSQKADEAKVKQLVGNLKGLHIRTFEFGKEGDYSDTDLAPLKSQLTNARGWSKIIDIAESGEHTEVYARKDGDRFAGITVIAAERHELTVVYVDGPIDLSQLRGLVKGKVDIEIPEAVKK